MKAAIPGPTADGVVSAGRPRVLFIQQYLPKYDAILYEKLTQAYGFDVWVAADLQTPDGLNQHAPESAGYHAVHQKVLVRGGVIRMPGIGALVRRVKPDVVVALGNPRFLMLTPWLLYWRVTGVKATVWGMFHRNGPTPWTTRLLFGMMALAARRSLVYGRRGERELRESGVPQSRIRVVSTGVDLTACLEASRVAGDEGVANFMRSKGLAEKIVFLQVARLTAPKATNLLIDCMRGVREQFPDAVLVLVGDGPERASLMRQAAESGLADGVIFAGAIFDERELSCWFRGARAIVCGGAVGLLAYHALAYGTPVIAHSSFLYHGPEAESIVHGSTGLLYREADMQSLTAAICHACGHEEEMRAMGRAGQQTVRENFTIEAKALRFRDALLELAEERDERKA